MSGITSRSRAWPCPRSTTSALGPSGQVRAESNDPPGGQAGCRAARAVSARRARWGIPLGSTAIEGRAGTPARAKPAPPRSGGTPAAAKRPVSSYGSVGRGSGPSDGADSRWGCADSIHPCCSCTFRRRVRACARAVQGQSSTTRTRSERNVDQLAHPGPLLKGNRAGHNHSCGLRVSSVTSGAWRTLCRWRWAGRYRRGTSPSCSSGTTDSCCGWRRCWSGTAGRRGRRAGGPHPATLSSRPQCLPEAVARAALTTLLHPSRPIKAPVSEWSRRTLARTWRRTGLPSVDEERTLLQHLGSNRVDGRAHPATVNL